MRRYGHRCKTANVFLVLERSNSYKFLVDPTILEIMFLVGNFATNAHKY